MSIRNSFSISANDSLNLLKEAADKKLPGCLVLSTCNRTEIYGLSIDEHELFSLFCTHVHCTQAELSAHAYVYRGLDALEHLFKVASGLDSQIIGDYEILAQLKQAFLISKEQGCINGFMERAVNYALQVSKEIKTKTKLSTGTVSVSYAAIEIIKEKVSSLINKKILLAGTGKFGNHIAKNLKTYLPGADISFINRTGEKARRLARVYDAHFIPFKDLEKACDDADIIITSSAADNYLIHPHFLKEVKPRLVLDLSVPQNVDPAIASIQFTTLLNVDEVSQVLNNTIKKREKEIPKALKIISQTLNNLEQWHRHQANNPALVKVKAQLNKLGQDYFQTKNNEEQIHKTIASLAIVLKQKTNKGCQCIHALNNYLKMNYEKTA